MTKLSETQLNKRSKTAESMEEKELIIQFVNPAYELVGSEITVPSNISKAGLGTLVNDLLQTNDSHIPYTFALPDYNSIEITESLSSAVDHIPSNDAGERTLRLLFLPLATFRVKSVTRCTASLSGHTEAILIACFSPDGTQLATGSGDTTVRLWDLNTATPLATFKRARNWILTIAWAPHGDVLAAAGMDTCVYVWSVQTGDLLCPPLNGHSKAVTSLVWQPMHLMDISNISPSAEGFASTGFTALLASASKDGTARIWNVSCGTLVFCITSHTNTITQVRWSGEKGQNGSGFIYTTSRDTSVKVWEGARGAFVRELKGHAHWVNTCALNTEYALKNADFDPLNNMEKGKTIVERVGKALDLYKSAKSALGEERMLTGSDDFTLILWQPSKSSKAINRMTGHQQTVNHVAFSPDGNWLASASFDKSIRLWNGRTGVFTHTLRGHVGRVYCLTWSADSLMLVSGSADSTVKLWDIGTRKLKHDLPGHADEVYTLDWSADGRYVATGSKDRILKIWSN